MKIEINDNLIKKIWRSRTDKKQTIDHRITELLEKSIKQKCVKCGTRLECPKCNLVKYECSECGTPLYCPECDEPYVNDEDDET